ncbi:enoyl-CoA hydratase-related protein [Chryseobacterium tructae]|uniref:Enoyl-CoA hydratase-related protein n=1 Tax=Chryseobacterium tructae TaxID=1037380 RepID=A0ABV7Y066_9FLAO|nr:enoyl-CoA hydratase-related protein [Chryseobacterium tructae]MDN3693140.1 enoyl-CoA hydratase-related protein [Chryseobacterium tructae]
MNTIIHEFPLSEIKKPETALQESIGWLKKYQLIENGYQAANAGAYFTALSYPDIKNFQVRDITDFCSWVCLLDDVGEEILLHKSLPEFIISFTGLKYICEEPSYQNFSHLGLLPENPIVEALLDLKARLSSWAEIPQINNLMKAVGSFTSGIQWENAYKIQNKYPDLTTFCALRIASGGMDIPFALAQCVNNVQLSTLESNNPVIQVLTKSIAFAALLDNDIYSYEKEKASNTGYYNNIIQIYLITYPDLNEEQAISKAIDLRNQILLLYQSLKQKFPYIYEPVTLYFKGLEDVISGNLIFCSTNKRYKVANDQKGRDFTITRNCKQYINPPKEISSISWWWSLLDLKHSMVDYPATQFKVNTKDDQDIFNLKNQIMNFTNLLYRQEGHIGILTINRPQVLNSINKQVLNELKSFAEQIKRNKEIRVLIITGVGEKAFVSGADLKAMQEMTSEEKKDFGEAAQAAINAIGMLHFPVIAAVNGVAIGGGCELALSCDIILASEKAKFGLPEAMFGIVPCLGGTLRLPKAIGLYKAKEMIFSGELYPAQTCKEFGFVNQIVPQEELMNEALKLANTIASRGPSAITKAKQSLDKGLELCIADGLKQEACLFNELIKTEDHKEGIVAFIEKRVPYFRGI